MEDKEILAEAFRVSTKSHALRLKVGAVLYDPYSHSIKAMDCNHMPNFMNQLKVEDKINKDGDNRPTNLVTKPELIHAESWVLLKGHMTVGNTLYVTDSPCLNCAKLIYQAGIKRVVYSRPYRITDGIKFLIRAGIEVVQMDI